MSGLALDSVAELRASVRGPVVVPADDAFAAARMPFNALVERTPAVIVQCLGVDDVVSALDFARGNGLPVSVRGGGHNVAGHAVCDDGVMISLQHLAGVEVDAAARVATAAGGTTWRDFDAACQEHGLATPGGTFGTTGIGGLTLGGGIGYLLGRFGLACDNLVGAQIVTADGRIVEASEHEHADLFWGLRGGGGNFGIATRLDYSLHPVETVFGGMLVYRIEGAREVVRRFRDLMTEAPDHLTCQLLLGADRNTRDAAAIVLVCCTGPDDPPELGPLRSSRHLAHDHVARIPYLELQAMMDMPFGMRNYWKGHFVRALSDELIDELVERFGVLGRVPGGILIEALHGAVRRVPGDATAVNFRQAPFNVSALGVWESAEHDDEQIAWARETADAIAPHSLTGGGYLNYMGHDEPLERVRAAFGDEKFDRLRALKTAFDPDNIFRLNQNIPPR